MIWVRGKNPNSHGNVRGKHWKLAKKRIVKPFTEEHRKKLGEYSKGSNNYRWKGGIENKLWHNRNRRALYLGADGYHSLREWENLKAQYNWTCPACKKSEPAITLGEDHIIPLSKGGSHNIENIQPLCRSCNSKKQTKIIKY